MSAKAGRRRVVARGSESSCSDMFGSDDPDFTYEGVDSREMLRYEERYVPRGTRTRKLVLPPRAHSATSTSASESSSETDSIDVAESREVVNKSTRGSPRPQKQRSSPVIKKRGRGRPPRQNTGTISKKSVTTKGMKRRRGRPKKKLISRETSESSGESWGEDDEAVKPAKLGQTRRSPIKRKPIKEVEDSENSESDDDSDVKSPTKHANKDAKNNKTKRKLEKTARETSESSSESSSEHGEAVEPSPRQTKKSPIKRKPKTVDDDSRVSSPQKREGRKRKSEEAVASDSGAAESRLRRTSPIKRKTVNVTEVTDLESDNDDIKDTEKNSPKRKLEQNKKAKISKESVENSNSTSKYQKGKKVMDKPRIRDSSGSDADSEGDVCEKTPRKNAVITSKGT